MNPFSYYEFSNWHGETYYAYGTTEELPRFLAWLEDTGKTPFVVTYAKQEDFKYCLCMADVLGD